MQSYILSRYLETIRAQSQAPQTSLKLFVSVPSLLQAHPLIDTVSWFFLRARIIGVSGSSPPGFPREKCGEIGRWVGQTLICNRGVPTRQDHAPRSPDYKRRKEFSQRLKQPSCGQFLWHRRGAGRE